MASVQSFRTISADHLQDLARSGINEETAKACGIYTVPPNEIKRKLGFDLPQLKSMYALPYPHTDGFERYRCFYNSDGKHAKYLQRKKSGCYLYIPPILDFDILQAKDDLIIVEGEKKAICSCLHGLPAVAISGLWNWSDGNGGLCRGFDLLNFDRNFLIVPDSDYDQPKQHGYRKDLLLAVRRLSKALINRGAIVEVVQLPKHTKGLDDFVMSLQGGANE